jgi:hypothetical protein
MLKGAIVALMVMGVAGCAVKTDDIHAKAYKSEKANMDAYKTYQIVEGSGVDKDAAVNWVTADMDINSINAELEKTVTDELTKRGKTQVSENPDMYVAYGAAADSEVIEAKLEKSGKAEIKVIPQAAMVLVLIDAKTHKIIWMSAAQGEAKALPADQRKKRVEYAVKKMIGGM